MRRWPGARWPADGLFYLSNMAAQRIAKAVEGMAARYGGASLLQRPRLILAHPSRPLPIIGSNRIERIRSAAAAVGYLAAAGRLVRPLGSGAGAKSAVGLPYGCGVVAVAVEPPESIPTRPAPACVRPCHNQ